MKKRGSKKARITTIEGLATAVAEGFADLRGEINDHFDKVYLHFDRIEEKLEEIEKRLTAVESKVLGIQRRLDDEAMERVDVRALFARMERIETEVFGKKQS